MQGMFMSFPLGYFKHFSNESVQKTWCFLTHEWGPVGTAAIPSPKKRGTRSLSTSIRWQPGMGLPEWGLSLASVAARRRPGEGGWAPWGCLVPLPHSHTVRHQFHCQPVLSMSPLQQPSLLSLCFPKHSVSWMVFLFNCIWKFRGWRNLKNTSWNSDTQTAECLK